MSVREPAADEADRLVGATVGDKYKVERLIGRGGMGAVYAAQNTAIGKRVALKFLSREAAQHRDATRRFQREAQAASLIESEHIVQVFDAGTSPDGLPFLVMEHLTGEDLRARLARDHQLAVAEALAIATQVLRALVRAHAAGIVHRDLKPDNVFLCARDDGSLLVKIVDFGISKLERATLSERLTRRGTLLGSAFYMSPEQAQASDDVDHRSDLYGVGAILFEMLAGRPPHVAPTLESVLVAICSQDAPNVCSLRPDVPEATGAAVEKALERDPAARFESAADFLATLAEGKALRSKRRVLPARSRTLVAGVVATLVGFTITALLVTRRAPSNAGADAPPQPTTPTADASLGPASTTKTPTIEVRPVSPDVGAAEPPVPSAAPAASRASPRLPASAKPAERKRRAAPSPAGSGVASSLQLSNREP